jgi:hypothetical protein
LVEGGRSIRGRRWKPFHVAEGVMEQLCLAGMNLDVQYSEASPKASLPNTGV